VHRSAVKVLVLLCALLAGGASADPQRAAVRFGYGAPVAAGSVAEGRAGALRALREARDAAAQPARIPVGWQGFEQPLPMLFERARAEREARRADMATAEREFSREVTTNAAAWRLAACSRPELEPPLLARLTEFWFNHLNVSAAKGVVRPFVGHYVVHAIRAQALGRYEDLLLASARHPAMLLYLDQAQSVADGVRTPRAAGERARGLNENYARELLELHTLGVQGGYAQGDVRELARVLTGWTVDPRSETGFRFAARLHDHGTKTVLGQRIEPAGEAEGESVIRRLARHPATAQRIALRLAQWFVADEPPPSLVQRLSERWVDSGGDIAAVMTALIESPEAWSPDHRLFKTPFDYACSTLAASGGLADERTARLALGFLRSAGQPVHGWATPDGYKTDAATWLSPEALTRRADFAMALGRQVTDPAPLLGRLTPAARARIEREPLALQAGLALASPDFMHK
jgi:uncharacterized protein (DUF1800 family)